MKLVLIFLISFSCFSAGYFHCQVQDKFNSETVNVELDLYLDDDLVTNFSSNLRVGIFQTWANGQNNIEFYVVDGKTNDQFVYRNYALKMNEVFVDENSVYVQGSEREIYFKCQTR